MLVAAYLWAWKRAGSGFFLLQRLLFIVGGNKSVSDKRIDNAWQKVYDFYSIRLRTGIKFSSNSNISLSIDFLDKHGIGLEQIIPIKNYFNANTCEIRDPNLKGKKIENLVMATFLLLVSTPIVLLGMPSQALLTVKETKTTFWTSGKSAYSWNVLEWKLNSEACQNEQIPPSKRDREVICDLLAQPENGYISDTILEQRIFGLTFLIFTVITLTAVYASYSKARIADEIRKRTHVPPKQLELF
ncbi:MAG: hypothetical protein IR163_06350 [Pseudomonas sp.]|nr:hypothetical protein [Pseudomonas sp.]